jgi:hypothetical protein
MRFVAAMWVACILAGDVIAMEVASDAELASVTGMICCCWKKERGDMCTGPARIGAACNQSSTLGRFCTDITDGPKKHDILVSYNGIANLYETYCKKYKDGVCAVHPWTAEFYCEPNGVTPTNGTRKAGTGKQCPWYW